jgi:RNA polymerase sigma-70 factor (ECF subfamily)
LSNSPPPEDSHHVGDTAPPSESWLVRFRPWLMLIAQTQVDQGFQGKFDASDIVQQTLIEAWRSAAQFRGKTEAERIAWLRQILAHVLAHEVRRYCGTLKRDVGREFSFEKSIDQSSQRLDGMFVSALTSPSQQVARQEQQLLLAETLERLPADYREVLVLRHLEGLSHDEIAQRMGRSPGAVRMLWMRALEELRRQFAELSSSAGH